MTPHDRLALATFGRTRQSALDAHECIRCRRDLSAQEWTAPDWREYRISALCPACFEALTPEEEPR